MAKLRRYAPPSSAALLRHVLERPELVAAVRELPGAALAELVDRVGLEDAGEIVALATTEQLAHLFDRDLWRAPSPGADEEFQPERFALWLEILAEAGDVLVAERLAALPRDLLVLAVHRLVLVLDLDALAVQLADAGDELDAIEKALESAPHEEWEELRLITRDPATWDVVWSALLALDRDHHALLRAVLEQCAALDAEVAEDEGGLYEVLTAEAMLENDVGAARSDRRAAEGHVAPADARAFLALGPIEEGRLERDPLTHAYFRDLPRVRAVVRHRPSGAPTEAPSGLATLEALLAEGGAETPTRRGAPRLEAGTHPSRRGRRRREAASSGPTGRGGPLERALEELRPARPEVVDLRLEELAYLANVLIAGSAHAGRTPRPIEALDAALRTCNAGLARALGAPRLAAEAAQEPAEGAARGEAPLSPAAELVARLPADVLFRLGRSSAEPPPPADRTASRRR